MNHVLSYASAAHVHKQPLKTQVTGNAHYSRYLYCQIMPAAPQRQQSWNIYMRYGSLNLESLVLWFTLVQRMGADEHKQCIQSVSALLHCQSWRNLSSPAFRGFFNKTHLLSTWQEKREIACTIDIHRRPRAKKAMQSEAVNLKY